MYGTSKIYVTVCIESSYTAIEHNIHNSKSTSYMHQGLLRANVLPGWKAYPVAFFTESQNPDPGRLFVLLKIGRYVSE